MKDQNSVTVEQEFTDNAFVETRTVTETVVFPSGSLLSYKRLPTSEPELGILIRPQRELGMFSFLVILDESKQIIQMNKKLQSCIEMLRDEEGNPVPGFLYYDQQLNKSRSYFNILTVGDTVRVKLRSKPHGLSDEDDEFEAEGYIIWNNDTQHFHVVIPEDKREGQLIGFDLPPHSMNGIVSWEAKSKYHNL